MLRHDGQSGSIPVQAVNTAEDERTVLLFKIVREGIRQGIVIIVHGRVDRHSRRLVDHHKVRILVDNI